MKKINGAAIKTNANLCEQSAVSRKFGGRLPLGACVCRCVAESAAVDVLPKREIGLKHDEKQR